MHRSSNPLIRRLLKDNGWSLAGTCVLLVGAVMRWWGLARFPFEQDELYTLQESRELFATTLQPGIDARPFYYLLHHTLTPILPATEWGARMPGYFLGLIGLVVTWRLGKFLGGKPGGFLALCLSAFSPWHLFVSGDARYWSLVYLISAGTLLQLLKARDSGRWSAHVTAGVLLVVGALTHPTFLFPVVGIALASLLEPTDHKLAFRWPSHRELLGTWLPAALLIGGYLFSLKLEGRGGSLSNWSGRGWLATVKLVPAMVQLSTVALVTASALGVGCALRWGPVRAKRLSLMAMGGVVTGTLLLLIASLRTDVYADYGISMLPLGIAAASCLLLLPGLTRIGPVSIAFSAILVAAMLPETVSQLVDGMRFDDRPALKKIADAPIARPALVWPAVVQQHYAPAIHGIEFRYSIAQLDSLADAAGTFWVIASVNREGLVGSPPVAVQEWLDRHCRTELVTGSRRFDYRIYRVILYACVRDAGVVPPS